MKCSASGVLLLRRIPPGVAFALGVVALLACEGPDTSNDEEDDNQFREDVIQCEEAIARLQRCCPDFDGARVVCDYYFLYDTSTCGPRRTESVQPALSLPESRCVLDTACEILVARGICDRAQEARAYTSRRVDETFSSTGGSTGGVDESDSHPPVCP